MTLDTSYFYGKLVGDLDRGIAMMITLGDVAAKWPPYMVAPYPCKKGEVTATDVGTARQDLHELIPRRVIKCFVCHQGSGTLERFEVAGGIVHYKHRGCTK